MAASQSLSVDAVPVPDVPVPKAGYAVEIFEKREDQDKFSCGFCHKILREPLQADCGHRFCTVCQKAVEELIQKGQKVLCKFCKDEEVSDEESQVIPSKMFSDRGIKREMMNVRTKCPNDMCGWQGLFKEYIKHEDECKFQPLICEKCGEPVAKQKMNTHKEKECPQRTIECNHCQVQYVHADKNAHLKECPKLPEPCSQCSKNIPRDKMKKHKSQECPNRTVSCPVEGCSAPQPQGRFLQHVQKDQPKHLAWVLSHMADLEESVAAFLEPGSPSKAAGGPHRLDVTEMDNLKTKMGQFEQQLQELIRQRGAGTATGGSAEASGGAEASASAATGADNSVERVNAMELKVNSLEPILSVLHGEMSRCISAVEALEQRLMQEVRKSQDVLQKVERCESTINTLSQREDKTRDLETRLLNISQDRLDGTLLWKISNFSKVRQDAVSGTLTNIHSRPFYTGAIGYKMCVRLYANGDGMGKGSHLSLFFTIMRGNHDALMPWPFKQKVFFMLIDQDHKKHIVDAFRSEPSSTSFQRPTSEMNIATGCPLFVQLDKLTQPGHSYIKDDTLYIRVVVETEGLDNHLKQFDPRTIPLKSGASN